MPEGGAHLRQRAMDLLSSYVEALETSPSPLYDREPLEVVSGLVARAGREVITALGAPDLWCMEHGAHVIRVLVEVRIYIQWMARQDPSVYRCACRKPRPRHATRRYSLIRQPVRVCLRARCRAGSTGSGSGFSGAAASSDQCGRC